MCRFMFVSQDLHGHASHPAWLTAFGDLYTPPVQPKLHMGDANQ